MNNEKMSQIVDEAYENYCMSYKDGHEFYEDEFVKRSFYREEFINKCKTNPEFSEKWGLKIEERELSLDERNKWSWDNWGIACEMESVLDEQEVPKRVITITYNNTKTEIYEE